MMKNIELDMSSPKVSVVIPCYNSENTISYTLNSLLNQTNKNFEVVIVNDGSVDNTESIIREYVDKLEITLISQSNTGVSEARNVALSRCKGQYITFLDADDEYHPEFISFLVSEIENNKVDMVTSKYKHTSIYEDKFEEVCCVKKLVNKEEVYKIYNSKRVQKLNFVNCIFINDIIKNNNIKFSSDYKYGEDSLFFLEYLFYCKRKIEVTDAVLYNYVEGKVSASKARNYERIQIIDAFKKAKEIWDQDEKLDCNISQYAIDRAIWAQAKDFSIANIKLLKKLVADYDVRIAMKNMAKNSNEKPVAYSAKIYLISKHAFVFFMKMYNCLLSKK